MENLSSEYLVVEGGIQLNGDVEISGAKNSVLKKLAASIILAKGTTVLHNVPNLADIDSMIEIIHFLGGQVEKKGNSLYIDCSEISSCFVPHKLSSKLRASFIVLGALVARFKEAKVSMPGGCQIGARKVDLHTKGIKLLGTEINGDQGYIEAQADKLVGNRIYLDVPSNGATENIMLAAVLAEGETVIENAARDPEIIDLANFLNKMGCDIQGAGTSTIHILGKTQEDLHSLEDATIPDRIEAATYMAAALITKGKVTVKSVIEEHLQALLSKFEEIGARIEIHQTDLKNNDVDLVDITIDAQNQDLKGTDITTVWYPGFPTDAQALFTALLALGEGTSVINENIYEYRFQHVEELERMGANINLSGKTAVIKGVEELNGANVCGKDLRSTAALIVAALAANGKSQVTGLEHLDRGYEKLEEKFTLLGAKIERHKPKAIKATEVEEPVGS